MIVNHVPDIGVFQTEQETENCRHFATDNGGKYRFLCKCITFVGLSVGV